MSRRPASATSLILAVLLAGSAAAQEPKPSRAFAVEAVGGALGSAAGVGVGLALTGPEQCGEDLGCALRALGTSGLLSSAAAPLGVRVAGAMGETRPSMGGAVIGSLAGVAAGVGMLKLLEESTRPGIRQVPALVVHSATHGIVTALGSRIGAALRR